MTRSAGGERIGGYRVVRRLATGGTSDVLLAKAEGPLGFERTVVLKLLLAEFQSDEEVAGMFAREASAYARLSHPSIVQLYDFFAMDGQLVMVLEHVDGPALHRLRGMLRTIGAQLDDAGSLFVAARVFSALASAHAAKDDAGRSAPVIHRDVNPSNILLPWDGQVKLADFGIAKVAGSSHHSAVGVIKGTYGYMAPEQVTGQPVTPATDVYAGAIVLWELLTRRRAFQRGALPEVEALRQMAEPHIAPLDVIRADLPRDLRDVVKRALEPDVGKRDVSAEEMLSVLSSLVSAEQGRVSLATSLSEVRHEPRPTMTSMPPADEDDAHTGPAAPKPPPAAGKAPPPAAPRARAGEAPPLPPPRAPSPRVAAKPVAVVRAGGAPPSPAAPPAPSVRTPPPPRPSPRRASAPSAPELSRGEPLGALGAAAEALRAVSDSVAPGISLRDAIDEVLREVPSNIPLDVFEEVSAQRPPEPSPAPHELGKPPPAPSPLSDVTSSASSPGPPESFPALDRTVTMERRPAAGPARGPVEEPVSPHEAPRGVPPTDATRVDALLAGAAPATPAPAAAVPEPSSTLPLLPAVLPACGPPPAGGDVAGGAPPPLSSASTTSSAPSATASATAKRPRAPGWMVVLAALAALGGAGAWFGRHRLAAAVAAVRAPAGATAGRSAPGPSTAPTVPVPAEVSAAAPIPAAPVASGEVEPSAVALAPAAPASPTPTAPPATSGRAGPVAQRPVPPAVASTVPSPKTAPTTSAHASGTGSLRTAAATPGRRIFVDERTVGQTPETVTVRCGVRAVKLGSAGRVQRVDVPCGGEVSLSDRAAAP